MLSPPKKVGVVDFTKARGKISKPMGPSGTWALKHYQSLGICNIYNSHFIFEVIYHCFNYELTLGLFFLVKTFLVQILWVHANGRCIGIIISCGWSWIRSSTIFVVWLVHCWEKRVHQTRKHASRSLRFGKPEKVLPNFIDSFKITRIPRKMMKKLEL